jgi:hypothetical protein
VNGVIYRPLSAVNAVFDSLGEFDIWFKGNPSALFRAHLIPLAFNGPQCPECDGCADGANYYEPLGIFSDRPSPKDHIGVKLICLILTSLLGCISIWIAVHIDFAAERKNKTIVVAASFVIGLLALCGAGILLSDLL